MNAEIAPVAGHQEQDGARQNAQQTQDAGNAEARGDEDFDPQEDHPEAEEQQLFQTRQVDHVMAEVEQQKTAHGTDAEDPEARALILQIGQCQHRHHQQDHYHLIIMMLLIIST